jgi:4-amino-4-deoxy-L-arabinose transferase-like glycosyltransferase
MPLEAQLARVEPLGASECRPTSLGLVVLTAIVPAALALVLFFFHLGTYGLWEPDEARYAEIAREMLVSHDFIVPHLNYVPYVEKPPLLYWLTAASMRLFGVSEFSARFVNAIAAFVGVMTTYLFALHAFDRSRGVVSATILATSPLYALMAQVLTTDMLLTAASTIAIFSFFLQWRDGGRWWLICALAASVAVMTKGPIGAVLPLVSAAVFLWYEGQCGGAIRRFHVIASLTIVGVLSLPWFVALTLQQPDFFRFYFVGEHLRRFFEPGYSHGEPIYFYVPVIVGGFLPWSVAMFFIPWSSLAPSAARRFCLIVVATIFSLFSLASAKLVSYILPAFPFLAVAVADGLLTMLVTDEAAGTLPQTELDTWRKKRPAVMSALLVLAGVAVIAVASRSDWFASPYVEMLQRTIYVAGTTVIICATISSVAFWRRCPETGLTFLVIGTAATLIIISYGRLTIESTRSYAALARSIARKAPSARLICYPRFMESLPFYCQRRVILVGAKTELTYGAQHSPDASDFFFQGRDDLLRLWNQYHDSVLVIDRGALPEIQGRLGSYQVIASDSKKLALIHATQELDR